jgi:hypothetical protein
MVVVALIGFAAISIFKLHSRLPEKKVESEEEVEPTIPVEISA